jgi:hypothetical protein
VTANHNQFYCQHFVPGSVSGNSTPVVVAVAATEERPLVDDRDAFEEWLSVDDTGAYEEWSSVMDIVTPEDISCVPNTGSGEGMFRFRLFM